MKTLVVTSLLLGSFASGWALTTIDATNQYAYGANIGWMDWRGDTNNGAVIGEYGCSGYIYAANVGWINLGSGSAPKRDPNQQLAGHGLWREQGGRRQL